jgi:hypothetical protein
MTLLTMSKRTIKAKEIVSDIRSGMSSRQLMDKYRISANSLHNLFRKLVHMKIVQIREVQALLSSTLEESDFKDRRKDQRYYVFVQLPIYDVDDLLREGQVVDLSKGGLRITGLPAKVGDKKDFLIQADCFASIIPFVFEAECRWASKTKEGVWFAGFQITGIPEKGLEELEKIIHMLTLSE